MVSCNDHAHMIIYLSTCIGLVAAMSWDPTSVPTSIIGNVGETNKLISVGTEEIPSKGATPARLEQEGRTLNSSSKLCPPQDPILLNKDDIPKPCKVFDSARVKIEGQ